MNYIAYSCAVCLKPCPHCRGKRWENGDSRTFLRQSVCRRNRRQCGQAFSRV